MRISLMLWSRPLAILFAAALLVAPATAFAQNTEQDFKEAYFQQTHQNNLKAAIAAYEKVIANPEAPAALRAEAQTRLTQCQEDQAAANFAQLMPPDATLYVELRDPGKHVGNILRMVGLSREPQSPSEAARAGATPLPGGLALPHDISISPALLRDLGKVKGLAASITGVDQRGIPSGVAVIHPGELDLLRGLIETGLQVLPQGEPVEGFKVYQVQGEVWIAVTSRLLIVSGSRDQVAQAAARLKNPEADSLAKQPQFSRLASDRDTALAFVYVNGRRALEIARPHMRGQEAMMAQMFLDLGNLESVSAAIGTNENGIHAHAKVVLAEGHRNMAYGMIRTAPLTKRSLAHVPAGAAAVAVVGLNPADQAEGQGARGVPTLSAMDIGREVFSNVEEISLFVMPGERGDSRPVHPEIGMIAAVKDPAKSEALWDQLLSLAAMFGPQVAEPPKEIEIEGHKAKEYQFKGAPPIVVVRIADRAMAAGTRGAVTSALRAEGQSAITGDPQFKSLVDSLQPESSKAVLAHAARLVAVGAAAAPREVQEARQAAALIGDLKFIVATQEKPTEFSIHAAASGLPNVPHIFQAYMQQMQGRPRAVRAQSPGVPQPPRRIEEQPPAFQKQ